MAVGIQGQSGIVAEVNSDKELSVALQQDSDKAGYTSLVAVPHKGVEGAAKLSRELDASPDYRLRVGTDTLLWNDTFNHVLFNMSKYLGVESTMTKILVGGRLAMNNGNSLASGAVARVQTFRTFPLYLSFALYAEFELLFTQDPVANNVSEFGLGYATGILTPTDGVYFRLNASGILQGVINNNGSETPITLPFVPASGVVYHYLIVLHNDDVEFWIEDVLYGKIHVPAAVGSPCLSMALPLLIREYNSAATALAQRMEIANISISVADLQTNKLWSTQMAGMGNSSVNAPDGQTPGQTSNNVNITAPVSATLANATAGYATLGGQFQFVAVAGAETDYALFAYLVPAGTPAIPGKNLVIRGIHIETFNSVVAVATTPFVLQWSIGVGSTAITLLTVDSATAGTRAPRRINCGIQYLPIAAPVGAVANAVDINLDAPIMVEAGTYLHIILKIPVGTATATEILRGIVTVNGFFE